VSHVAIANNIGPGVCGDVRRGGRAAADHGGASPLRGAWRVAFWGALAMALTAGVGALFGVAA